MFSRKIFVIALLAIVLLSSFMDSRINTDTKHRRKPRAMLESVIAQVDQTLQQANFTKLVNPVENGISAFDPGSFLTSRTDGKPRRHRVSVDGIQMAGGAKALDPAGLLTGRTDGKPRRHRVSVYGIQMAGGPKMLDPAGRPAG